MIERAATLVWRATYARYVAASGLSLAADLTLFMILLSNGVAPVPASALGYILGLFVHWRVSSLFVFRDGTAIFPSRRRRRRTLFVASALVGLGITSAVVGVGSLLGLDPRLAKLIAIAVSFQITYILRKTVVFA